MKEQFSQFQIDISDRMADRFSLFLKLFMEYNSHTNLSAIRDEDGIVLLHFIDSCILSRYMDLEGEVLDIGTGGGFPGIPLAIRFPDTYFTLLDSVGKKTRACEHFARELSLPNIEVKNTRAELLAKERAGRYDVVISRATAYMPEILAWAKPFLTPKGQIILLKSPSEEEIADGKEAARKLRLRLMNTHEYYLGERYRSVFVFTRA